MGHGIRVSVVFFDGFFSLDVSVSKIPISVLIHRSRGRVQTIQGENPLKFSTNSIGRKVITCNQVHGF